jgi:hypothetical protein
MQYFSQSYGIFRLECAKSEIPKDGDNERRLAMSGSTPLIFVLGALIGVLVGGALCVRYLRHEIAADIGPRLRRIQLQLDNLESAVNLALITRYAEIASQAPQEPVRQILGRDGRLS